MKKISNNIKRNWETTLAGLLIAVFTIMFYTEKISIHDFVTALGAIGTITALLSKDADKTGIKP